MKIHLLILLSLWSAASFAYSESKDVSGVASVTTTAHIIGYLPDETPTPPELPKPGLIISARDVLDAESHYQNGRTITFQRIAPVALPASPQIAAELEKTGEPFTTEQKTEEQDVPVSEEWVMASATVYHPKDSPSLSHVQLWPNRGGQSVDFWSSVDFSLFSGVFYFTGTDGKARSLLLMLCESEVENLAAIQSEFEPDSLPIPDFTAGKASFSITSGEAPASALVVIQSLHDIYHNENKRLVIAHEVREQARLQREAELLANPPQLKNITLNYWRIGDTAAKAEGGSK